MPQRIFGHISGIPVGQTFTNRVELSLSRLHPPRRAGISGSQDEGADSIVLSNAYEDDVDYGDVIIYTGYGSRDQKTGKQIADQLLSAQNLALATSCKEGLPVRVIRGPSPGSPHAPETGYRYDGLYTVESYWQEKGKSGFLVWRFRLTKQKDA